MKIAWQVLDKSKAAPLGRTLATDVVNNIAGLSSRNLFYGQSDATRAQKGGKTPPMSLYTGLPTFAGPPEDRYAHPGVATVVEGKLNIAMADLLYQAHQGDWIIFPPHVTHLEFCLHSRLPYHVVWFQFPIEPGIKIGETFYSREEGFQVDRYQVQSCPLEVHRSLGSIIQTPGQPLESIRWRLLHLVSWWLCSLNEEASEPVLHTHSIIDRIHTMLEEPEAFSVSVTELARRLGLSLSHVSRLYRLHTGQTLHRVIQEKRIQKACSYLAESTLSIKEISLTLGFADLQHFNHVFRHMVGVSPSAYRRHPVAITDNQ